MSARKAFEDLTLLGRYFATLARYNLVLPWLRPEAAKRFVSAVLEHDFFGRGGGRRLKAVSIHTVFPELEELTWTMVGKPWDVEAPYLCGALKAIGAKRVLEIGTLEGAMTLQLAANVPEDGHVYTVDIDPAQLADAAIGVTGYDRQLADKVRERIGCRFHGTPYADRITQIIHDSATLDYSQYFDTIDLAYIDGGHSYAQVKADTEKVRPLVRPGGVVFWHDYQPGCRGVTRYLHELARQYPVRNVNMTQLAVLRL